MHPAERFGSRRSVIEMRARERARALLDPGSFRELLGPFERLESPWLPLQGIVPQADDGVVVARGLLAGQPAVVLAIEGAFQGGSIGEVSGTKIAAALALARQDCENGKTILPILFLESGGVRLQEAHLGEALVAEIHAEIIALRRHVSVIGVITGMVGCFGGMAIAAGLCSYLVVFPQGRLGLNGPEVIEQEAGIEEMDARDRPLIWSLMGGQHCCAAGLADVLIEDDADLLRQTIRDLAARGLPPGHRSERGDDYRHRLALVAPARPSDARDLRPSRGRTWFHALAGEAPCVETGLDTVLVADASLGGEPVRLLAVVPDPHNRFPRARQGELGLEEGWALACHVRDAVAADQGGVKRPLVAIVDVKSQAYGRLEALLGIHLALAAAVDAYASARLAGHPVVALVVGSAISGGLLAHGAQAHRLLALDAPGVTIHAMSKAAAARVTRRSVETVEALGRTILPMTWDIRDFARLGLLHELLAGVDADAPSPEDIEHVKTRVTAAITDIRHGGGDLTRLNNAEARVQRAASIEVRRRLAEQWNG
jgi:malonate decarboxylase beta subunit